MNQAFFSGFCTGMGSIAGIGPQNIFVLRQGVAGRSVALVVASAVAADALLISAGVCGTGAVLQSSEALHALSVFAGFLFVLMYTAKIMRDTLCYASPLVAAQPAACGRRAVLSALSFSLLNPQAILDTVLLIGTASSGWGSGRWAFGLGACAASILWFSAIGFGAKKMSRLLTDPFWGKCLMWALTCFMIRVAWTLFQLL